MMASIVSTGARGALGLSSLQVALGARAGRFTPQSLHFTDRRQQPIGMGLCGGLGAGLVGYPRLIQLAAPALREAVAKLAGSGAAPQAEALPLVLCLPEAGRADDDARLDEQVIVDVATRAGVSIDIGRSRVVRRGYASFAHAIEQARTLLKTGAPTVVVGGVDSYHHPDVLASLDDAFRLHAIGASGGFIPSEAGAFITLRGPGHPGLGSIVDAATAKETSAIDDDAINSAEAMTSIITGLIERAGAPFRWAITDFNGEPHRYRQWDLVSTRLLPTDVQHTKWAWVTGDVGAASGALFTALAIELHRLGAVPFDRGLLLLHSEGPDRGAVVLQGGGA